MTEEKITLNGKTYYAEPPREAISTKITEAAIGKWAIIRTRNAGVNFGLVAEADETGVVLKHARRLHRVATEKGTEAWYEGVSKHGLADWCGISAEVETKIIIEDYEMTLCTEFAVDKIKSKLATKTTYEN